MTGAQRILIVGGLGAMARRLTPDLESRGHTVDPYDQDDPRDLESAVAQADVVMIAVPMAIAPDTVDRVAPHLRDDALLCDINSSKREVCARMAAHTTGEALGLHPMFGPSVASLRGQKIVARPIRTGPRTEALLDDFDAMGLERVETDPETHDRMMAHVQVLTHFSTLVMGEALRASGVDLQKSLEFTSPIYNLELAFVGRLFAQRSRLYAEILMTNDHTGAVTDAYTDAAHRIAQVVASGDRNAFDALFADIASYFRGFSDEAMRTSDRIIEALTDDA